jgi:mevalonate pyrophosphate decarboxylase
VRYELAGATVKTDIADVVEMLDNVRAALETLVAAHRLNMSPDDRVQRDCLLSESSAMISAVRLEIAEQQRKDLVAALKALRGNPCWCDTPGMGHTSACMLAQKAMREL